MLVRDRVQGTGYSRVMSLVCTSTVYGVGDHGVYCGLRYCSVCYTNHYIVYTVLYCNVRVTSRYKVRNRAAGAGPPRASQRQRLFLSITVSE